MARSEIVKRQFRSSLAVDLISGTVLFLRAFHFQFNLNQKSLGKANNFRTQFRRNSHRRKLCRNDKLNEMSHWMNASYKAFVSVSFNFEMERFLLKFSRVIFLFIFHLTEEMTKAEYKFLQFGEKLLKACRRWDSHDVHGRVHSSRIKRCFSRTIAVVQVSFFWTVL